MDSTRDFTSGPIVGPLIRFSLPILAALFLQALYGAVDLLVVGKYAATADVSGVAVGSQIMMTVTGLISSLAMGSTILLGQKLGMRAEKDCGRVIGVSIARDESVILAGADYLKAYAIDCLFTCFLFCFIGFYNGLGYTGFVSVQGVAAAFLVRIPVAILMRRVLGTLFGIGLGVPVATVFQILACFVFLGHLNRKQLLKRQKNSCERDGSDLPPGGKAAGNMI